jgi:hypothetical protein
MMNCPASAFARSAARSLSAASARVTAKSGPYTSFIAT